LWRGFIVARGDEVLATAVLPSQGLLENLAWSLRLPIDELDQPELAEVLAVWRAKHREARLPPRAAFDATDLKRAISHVMILDVRNGEREFVFRLAGSETVHIHRRELTGCAIAEIGDRSWQIMMRRELVELVERGEPQLSRLRYQTSSGLQRDYRELRLPLADDGRTVDRILIVQDFTVGLLRASAGAL